MISAAKDWRSFDSPIILRDSERDSRDRDFDNWIIFAISSDSVRNWSFIFSKNCHFGPKFLDEFSKNRTFLAIFVYFTNNGHFGRTRPFSAILVEFLANVHFLKFWANFQKNGRSERIFEKKFFFENIPRHVWTWIPFRIDFKSNLWFRLVTCSNRTLIFAKFFFSKRFWHPSPPHKWTVSDTESILLGPDCRPTSTQSESQS